MSYTIETDGPNTWRVVRESDGVIVKRGLDVKTALRWVKTWGEVDLGR